MGTQNIPKKAKAYLENKPFKVVWIFSIKGIHKSEKIEEYPDYIPQKDDILEDYPVEIDIDIYKAKCFSWQVNSRHFNQKENTLYIVWKSTD